MIKLLSQQNSGRTLSPYYLQPPGLKLIMFFVLAMFGMTGNASAASFGEALYFSLQPVSPLPSIPSSLLIGSAAYIDVPAGTKLSVYLMRGDTLISTSTLTFQSAYTSPR